MMRLPCSVLTLLAGIGMPACTAEPMPSSAASSPIVTVTAEQTMSSTDAHPAQQTRIPLLDQEAPKKSETATFALG